MITAPRTNSAALTEPEKGSEFFYVSVSSSHIEPCRSTSLNTKYSDSSGDGTGVLLKTGARAGALLWSEIIVRIFNADFLSHVLKFCFTYIMSFLGFVLLALFVRLCYTSPLMDDSLFADDSAILNDDSLRLKHSDCRQRGLQSKPFL